MNEDGNVYGLKNDDNQVDPHLMKNTELGVVAYLTQSKYGRNKTKPGINNSVYAGYNYATTVAYGSTKNIYGIYDINYKTQYVSAYLNNGNSNLSTYASSLLTAPNRHKDVYKVGTKGSMLSSTISDTSSDNYEASKEKYGDAIYETSLGGYNTSGTWFQGGSYIPNTTVPVFTRASIGYHSNFSSNYSAGDGSRYFRPVITVIN